MKNYSECQMTQNAKELRVQNYTEWETTLKIAQNATLLRMLNYTDYKMTQYAKLHKMQN